MIFRTNSLIVMGLSFAYISYSIQASNPLFGAFWGILAAFLLFSAARRLTSERKGHTKRNSHQ